MNYLDDVYFPFNISLYLFTVNYFTRKWICKVLNVIPDGLDKLALKILKNGLRRMKTHKAHRLCFD